MKKNLMMSLLVLFTGAFQQAFAQAPQENFNQILSKVQNANWAGHFRLKVGGTICDGPLTVKFFPMQVEDFSQGAMTMSYRHHADFSGNTDLLCTGLAAKLSPVDVGQCEAIFPMKYNPDEGMNVPFRTIIPRNNGKTAVISSPSCNSQRQVERQELNLKQAVLSPDQNQLTLTIQIKVAFITVNVDYILNRQAN